MYLTLPDWITAVPWAGAEVIESIVSVCPDSFAGPAESLKRTSTSTFPSSATEAVSSPATGGSLTSVTLTLTVAVAVFGSAAPLVVPLS